MAKNAVDNSKIVNDATINNFEKNSSSDKPSSSFDVEFSGGNDNMNSNKQGQKHNGGGIVVCAVCGAVRYYSFVKQARKFGVCACESCRKFISKMIHSQGHLELNCNGNKGECIVPPYVVNPLSSGSDFKGRRVTRCPACWLKQCLQTFNIPDELRATLTKKLPEFMQDQVFMPSKIPSKVKLRKKKKTVDYGYKTCEKEKSYNEFEPKIRQKRKAAERFMQNIARITGRITDEVMNPYFESRNTIKKPKNESFSISKKDSKKGQVIIKTEEEVLKIEDKGNNIYVKDNETNKMTVESEECENKPKNKSFSISREDSKKEQVIIKKEKEVLKIEDEGKNVNVKVKETNKIKGERKEYENLSVQDVFKPGRPRLIILARRIDFSPEYNEMEKRRKGVNMNSINEIGDDSNE